MRAVVIHETGGPEVLRCEDVPDPEPAGGEVLIRVRAASVNPVDWKFRRSMDADRLPMVPGRDLSGTVLQSRADGFAEGDPVLGSAGSGGYAELDTSPASAIARKPDELTWEQAAALPVAGITAWQALFDHGGLESGQTALIAGASGGVGHLAVQFAKHAGAEVIGTASGRNRDFVLGLGADRFVDYTSEDVAQAVQGVDLAFDTVGGPVTETLLPAVREGGILVCIAGMPPEDAARERGVRTDIFSASPTTEQLARIADLVVSGEARVAIAEVLPLSEARRAHELSEAGHVRGKLVLRVGDS
ncbi:MAG TPA: NADP-dependent oxidoreductase [Solirubrobacteraceae bacterium]|jgi:NADPH:quinone reductase-like Zn-dependent oxidoreductase|nr:NADP-dependent oxidoreductase [Solirubrobacteraceae bacterium]